MSRLNVFLTVDAEVWPVQAGGWPHRPLPSTNACERELEAHFIGSTAKGAYGLPYQLGMLHRHGLKATFFVDPIHSFALGIETLKAVVRLIEAAGQYVGLHLHPEWLTDERCGNLAVFRGPLLSAYPEGEQARLARIGWERLIEAGAHPVPAFRAGSWGASMATLKAVRTVGIRFDSSLNSHYAHSLPDFAGRQRHQDAFSIDDIVEVPVSRFNDGVAAGGKPLSFVGVSARETEFVLNASLAAGRRDAVIVLHSAEFVRTSRLYQNRHVDPRRIVVARFERICKFLASNGDRFATLGVHQAVAGTGGATLSDAVPSSHLARTITRIAGQLVSRWH